MKKYKHTTTDVDGVEVEGQARQEGMEAMRQPESGELTEPAEDWEDDDLPGVGDREREPARNAERAIREAELADVKRFIRFTRTKNPMALPAGSERWARENVDRIYNMRLTGPLSSQRHEAVCLWHHRERKRLAKMPNLIEGEW